MDRKMKNHGTGWNRHLKTSLKLALIYNFKT